MGDQIRPPISLANLPVPPELPGLHQDKALNLHVERQRALDELRRKEEERENLMKKEREREQEKREAEEREQREEREKLIRREMELKRERLHEEEEAVSPPPSKRHNSGSGLEAPVTPVSARENNSVYPSMPGTNIKITSRGKGAKSVLVAATHLIL